MKKIFLFALLAITVSGTVSFAQNTKNAGQPVKSLTATSYANETATRNEPAKAETKADKKDVKKETAKPKKETKPATQAK